MQELKGSFVALVTPMKSNGEIDLPTLKELVEWHIESGTHGVVSVGTTGESATLNFNDHVKVLEKTTNEYEIIFVLDVFLLKRIFKPINA